MWYSARLLFCFLSLSSLCQSQPAVPITIPIADSLKRAAAMVKRLDQLEIDILSPRKAIIHRRYVYTILNSQGDMYASVHTYYDKFHDLTSVTGILYDAAGKVLKKIRKKDMEDWNIDGAGILITDGRLKYYPFVCRSYPYTVSYEEEIELDGLFVLPSEWQPQPARGVSVENCSLVIKTPARFPLRYTSYHYPGGPGTRAKEGGPAIEENKNNKTYTWRVENQPAMPEESYQPAWYHLATRVLLAPGDFELEGNKGRLYSWADMGNFVSGLYQGRDRLPDEARAKVHRLVDGLTDPRQKIAVLYRFLQQNTHYVGIELGIGGWQPFDAASIYNKRYGDCKALSNYMVALLKEAGIPASNVLIRAGLNAPALDTAFACNQFNHAIVVAFAGRDSVWLECTSSLLAPGYLGSFTSDRNALLLDAAGSQLVHTPVYGTRDNRISHLVKGSIDPEGNLDASLQFDYSGLEQDALQSMIDRLSKKEQLAVRQQALGIQNATLKELQYATDSAAIPAIRENMQLSVDHYATITGNRLIFLPGVFFKRIGGLKEDDRRTQDFELPLSNEETDSVLLQLPAGYFPEGTLPSVSSSSPSGSYRIHCTFSDGKLSIVCRFRQYKGLYSANSYSRLARLFNLVHREGLHELVFVKQ